jgi:uncharacterized protein (TIRG00374 family)
MRYSRHLVTLLKVALAGGLIAWLIQSGRLEPARVAAAARHWPLLLGIVGVLCVQILIVTWRWNLLLRTQDIRLSYRRTLSLTMIGLASTLFMPGSVGGDLVKAYYVTLDASDKRPQAVMTIFLDRLIGLLGLLTVAVAGALLNLATVRESAVLIALATAAAVGVLFGATVFIIGALVAENGSAVVARLTRRLPLGGALWKCFLAARECRRQPAALAAAFAVTVPIHLLASLSFYLATVAVGYSGDAYSHFLFLVPLGLFATAIPVSPGGIGTGQAAFVALFAFLPGGGGSLGADACTVFQFVAMCVYMTGLWAYISRRRDVASAEIQDEMS